MSFNVAGSERLNSEELNRFLKRRLNDIDSQIDALTAEKVDGSSFFYLTLEGLKVYGIPLGASAKIVNLIKDIQEESPSNRRKYGNDDKRLERFWNSLKDGKVKKHNNDQFLELPMDVYYLLGKDEQGSNISTLFIRECYYHLSDIIFENENIHRWRITGNPGIGKTFFGYYLLYLLSQQCKTVVYHKLDMPPILFSEEGVFRQIKDNIHAFSDYLEHEETWYIVDGRKPMEYLAKTILVCSPQKRHYKNFDKRGTTIRYMPVWSWEEIDACRIRLFSHLSQREVRKLYNKWGGIPRFTLFCALNDSQQDLLQMAINS
ncbi:368_t:CDS:2 [Acaulospora colombiana]|uniref:368_t:CDS:1 n=1 Tax=Acaulospora colombiana TaxID=27376 RepID=A0ACA9KRP3_9GLOM|nr:368_t:CDS:2 [Acaulospora colombiana]